ncbi:c-type cytochrome [Enterovibrio norvegicus]|uniref:c-type cytochrome n=1 Tax=Enterovibrio norvegicus TaxID=188144 RepID=UPI0013D5E6D0|nr:cytochrome c [Enterovibrio norvegicus]
MLLRYFIALSVFFTSLPLLADMPIGNSDLGQNKAFSCQFCHGVTGYSQRDDYPHLNGQNAQYLFSAMQGYQQSERGGVMAKMMQQQLSALNDQDLADIATFYAVQKAGKPSAE